MTNSPLGELTRFFAMLSLLSFGGGKVVLPAIQREVTTQGWMTAQQFLHVYSLGQAAPGPAMLMVLIVGWKAAGMSGAVVAALAMFVPTCLLMVLLTSAWDKMAGSPWHDAIEDALAPITIGLILASAWVIGVTALTDLATSLICVASIAVMLRTKISTLAIVVVAGLIGWLIYH